MHIVDDSKLFAISYIKLLVIELNYFKYIFVDVKTLLKPIVIEFLLFY